MESNSKLFKMLSNYFKENVKLFFIEKTIVIIVTKDDKVYQFSERDKSFCSIAYTSDESMIEKLIEKSIVKEFCNRGVIDFKNGALHTIARTSDGKFCLWKVSENRVENEGSREIDLNKLLNSLNIIEISLGLTHTLVLTSEGDIYAWGEDNS
jgi:RCC1 and BTB domain-containing protein